MNTGQILDFHTSSLSNSADGSIVSPSHAQHTGANTSSLLNRINRHTLYASVLQQANLASCVMQMTGVGLRLGGSAKKKGCWLALLGPQGTVL